MQKTALISVSDKTGLVPFAKALVEQYSYRLLSTGGTAKLLKTEGIPVTEVSDYTGFPEMMEGRVKTLHPKIHGGLLARRDKEEHMGAAVENGIDMIDLVVVNLYPFSEITSKSDVTFELAVENIDIGGPSMLRSAAKNHASVCVVIDTADYDRVLKLMGSELAFSKLRLELAVKVFERTSCYDSAIASYLKDLAGEEEIVSDPSTISGIPAETNIQFRQAKSLRYGENPHQISTLFGSFFDFFEKIQGKELSFNNIIDITAATYLISEFEKPTVAILKHTNPCGVASSETLIDAWQQAFETDKQAPFGGIIVVNQTIESDLASIVSKIFCEVIIAPRFSDAAREIFKKKKNLRIIIAKDNLRKDSLQEIRSVVGGVLVQDRDTVPDCISDWKIVSKRQPTEDEMRALIFGWKVVKHVKSNAIVYAGCERTLGVGAGQMSRIDSSRIAIWKAGEANLSLKGSIVASDAFFPFTDGLIAAAEAGAIAAIQPGGSVSDEEVIAAANEREMAMIFTNKRHFKH